MDVLLSPDQSIEPVPDVCIDCVLLKSQVDALQQEVGTLQNQMQSMHQQIQSSQNLQNQVHAMSSRISNLQYYVQWLWNKQQTSNLGNSQQFQTIQNENQASTPSHAATRPTESANINTEQQPSRSFQTDDSAAIYSAESMEVEEEQVAVSSEDHEDERPDFFNNYSKEILEAKVLKIKDFSKCSKILLRLLYTDAERQGRSVTGTASCKKYAAKPALGHPERLKALYDIVMKRWTHVTIPEINKKLAEALKPSAS